MQKHANPKSPSMPLRNRKPSNHHSRNMSQIEGDGSEPQDNRISVKKMSKEGLNTKKAINRIYSFDLHKKSKKHKSRRRSSKRSSSSLVALVPKFPGCSPGGTNATLQARTFQNTSSQNNLRPSSSSASQRKPAKGARTNSSRLKLRSEESSNDLKANDKHLKRARHEAYRLKNESPLELEKKEKLLEFERKMMSNAGDLVPQPSKLVINHKQLLG